VAAFIAASARLSLRPRAALLVPMTDSAKPKSLAGDNTGHAALHETVHKRTEQLWRNIDAHFLRPEDECLTALLELVDGGHAHMRQVEIDTLHLVEDIRHSAGSVSAGIPAR